MANINLIRSAMAEAGCVHFVAELSRLLNISRNTASLKLNGKRPFKDHEIQKIAATYNLTAEQMKKILS